MSWWKKAKDAVKKAGKDISDTTKKAGKDIKSEADRLAERLKKERDKAYPYLLNQKPAKAFIFSKSRLQELKNKKLLYQSLSKQYVLNKDRTYFSINHCDGLIFDSLASIGGADVYINQYFKVDRWYRTHHKDTKYCLPHSGSTISNDMLIGMTLWAVWFKKKAIYSKTIDHLLRTNWLAGDSTTAKDRVSEAFVKPHTATLMLHANKYLKNNQTSILQNSIHPFSNSDKGYVDHLQALEMCIYDITDGKISPRMKQVIIDNVRQNPENPLHQYNHGRWITGNYDAVYSILTNNDYFPHGRLPTNRDRKTPWLPERHNNDFYKPDLSGAVKTWSGMDYCFIVSLLERVL